MHSLANPRFLANCPLSLLVFTGGWAIVEWMARTDYRDCRLANMKTGYLLEAFNPVIIETISFLSVCFV
jgi:hypothetical protein